MSPEGRVFVRNSLLELMWAESDASMANRIAHCVAQCAGAEPWPELLQAVCAALGQGNAASKVALFVLEQLPTYAPEVSPISEESRRGVGGGLPWSHGPTSHHHTCR